MHFLLPDVENAVSMRVQSGANMKAGESWDEALFEHFVGSPPLYARCPGRRAKREYV